MANIHAMCFNGYEKNPIKLFQLCIKWLYLCSKLFDCTFCLSSTKSRYKTVYRINQSEFSDCRSNDTWFSPMVYTSFVFTQSDQSIEMDDSQLLIQYLFNIHATSLDITARSSSIEREKSVLIYMIYQFLNWVCIGNFLIWYTWIARFLFG